MRQVGLRWGFGLAAVVCFLGWSGVGQAEEPTPATSEASVQEARLYFGNGVELLQADPPNYQDAYPQFQLAYEKSGQSWKVLGNLGLCALKLERDGEALAYYQRYLDQGGEQIDAEERRSIEREILLARGNMATLRLSTERPGVRVTVERQGSSVPAQIYEFDGQSLELGVRSGQLTLTAREGENSESWQVLLGAGESAEYSFTFAPPEPTAAPAAATAPSPAEVEQRRGATPLQIAGYATAGVGVAALVGGGVSGILAKQQESDAKDTCIEGVCAESTEGDLDAASDLAVLANALLIGGGVLTATGVTLVIVGGRRGGDEKVARGSLMVGPSFFGAGAGLAARGSF